MTSVLWSYKDEMLTVQPSAGGRVTMTYDGDHLRRKRQNGSGTTKYLWDGQQVLLETNGNGATQARYTLAPFGYGDLVSMRRNGATSFYHFDALGSTRALSGEDEWVTDTYLYSAFGNVLASTGSTANPYLYIGKLGYQQETGLSGYYLRRRYYQPGSGRFLSNDPAGRDGGRSYTYSENSPGVVVDPSGEQSVTNPIITLPGIIGNISAKCLCAGKDAARVARKAQKESGLKGQEADAFRHCVWQCDTTQRAGAACASAVGNAYETKGLVCNALNLPGGNAIVECWMDLENNKVGRRIGGGGGDCAKECMEALENGDLYCVAPGAQVPLPCR